MFAQDFISLEIFNPNNPKDRVTLEVPRKPSMLYTRLPQELLQSLGIDTGLTIPHLVIVDEGNDKLKRISLYKIGIKINDYECVTLAIPSEEKSIGYLTSIELGLRFKDGEISQRVVYSDPLIYEFIFEMTPNIYESIYIIKPDRELYRELLKLYDD